jgi:hypothetical protein
MTRWEKERRLTVKALEDSLDSAYGNFLPFGKRSKSTRDISEKFLKGLSHQFDFG